MNVRVYFGHHKCASTWIHEILSQLCREAGLRHAIFVDPASPNRHGPLTDYSRDDISRTELGPYIRNSEIQFVTCMASDMAQVDSIQPYRAFHVIRDPRDIIVSAYFSHRNSHPVEDLPVLAAHRKQLLEVDKDTGLFLEMEFSAMQLHDMTNWDYGRSEILEIKMEELTVRPYDTFIRIFEFLELMEEAGNFLFRDKLMNLLSVLRNRVSVRHAVFSALRKPIPFTGEMLLGRVYDNRYSRKARGRDKGRENVNHHYRKGVSGDWANHFTEDHVRHFKGCYGDLLVKLGYEQDHSWTSDSTPERIGL